MDFVHLIWVTWFYMFFFPGDGPNLRDFVINHGVVAPLLKFVNPNVPVRF